MEAADASGDRRPRRGHPDRRRGARRPRVGDRGRGGRVSCPRRMSDQTTTTPLEIDSFLGNAPPRTAQLHADRVTEILRGVPGAASRRRILRARDGRPARATGTCPSTSPNERTRRVIRTLGLDGRARLSGDGVIPVVASWRALGNAHVGALVHTTVRQTIRIREDGSAAVDAEVLFENDAGTDPPSVLLGRPVGGFPVGTFAADVTLSLPAAAEQHRRGDQSPEPDRGGTGPRARHRDGFDHRPGRRLGDAHRFVRRPRRGPDDRWGEPGRASGPPPTDPRRGEVPDPPGAPGQRPASSPPRRDWRGAGTPRSSRVSGADLPISSCASAPARPSRAPGSREAVRARPEAGSGRCPPRGPCRLFTPSRRSAIACAIRRSLLAGRDADPTVIEDVEEVLEDGALVPEQRCLGHVQGPGEPGERLDRRLDMTVLVSREAGLRDAGDVLELGLAETGGDPRFAESLTEVLPIALMHAVSLSPSTDVGAR